MNTVTPKSDLLILSFPDRLSASERGRIAEQFGKSAAQLGLRCLVVDGGMTAQVQPNVADLLAEQRTQTQLLRQIADNQVLLIEALASEPEDHDAMPPSYLSGHRMGR